MQTIDVLSLCWIEICIIYALEENINMVVMFYASVRGQSPPSKPLATSGLTVVHLHGLHLTRSSPLSPEGMWAN